MNEPARLTQRRQQAMNEWMMMVPASPGTSVVPPGVYYAGRRVAIQFSKQLCPKRSVICGNHATVLSRSHTLAFQNSSWSPKLILVLSAGRTGSWMCGKSTTNILFWNRWRGDLWFTRKSISSGPFGDSRRFGGEVLSIVHHRYWLADAVFFVEEKKKFGIYYRARLKIQRNLVIRVFL